MVNCDKNKQKLTCLDQNLWKKILKIVWLQLHDARVWSWINPKERNMSKDGWQEQN